MSTPAQLAAAVTGMATAIKTFITTKYQAKQLAVGEDAWVMQVEGTTNTGLRYSTIENAFELVDNGSVTARFHIATGNISTIGDLSPNALISVAP